MTEAEVGPGRHRGVLVGYGTIGEGHLEGYRRIDRLDIVAVVDRSEQRRERAVRDIPGAFVCGDWTDLPAGLGLDFVDVCTPPDSHLGYIELALGAGLHVLCEKPLVMGVHEIAPLVEAVAASTAVFFPSHNYKYAPTSQAMARRILDTTSIGEVVYGSFETVRVGHARGVREWSEHWRRDLGVGGGGILRDHGPHSIYMASHWLRELPLAVSCHLEFPTSEHSDTEDRARLELTFPSAQVHIDLSWRGEGRSTSYLLAGTRGVARVLGDRLEMWAGGDHSIEHVRSEFDDPRHGSWFGSVLDDFAAQIDTGETSLELLREALMTILVIDAAYSSAQASSATVVVDYDQLSPYVEVPGSTRKALVNTPSRAAATPHHLPQL